MRPTVAEVALDAVAQNVEVLRQRVGRHVELCAVVKADGYGHGAVPVARTALEAGATWLAVAIVEEAAVLRAAEVQAPILVLAEPGPDDMDAVVDLDLRPAVYTSRGIAALAEAARTAGRAVAVHLKVDTGMHRVGCDPSDAVRLAGEVAGAGLELDGLWTHCAVADEPDDLFTDTQLDRFDDVVAAVRAAGHHPRLVHAGNSAVAIAHPRGHHDLVRCGIALYGVPPSSALADAVVLRPALRLRSGVSLVRRLDPGETVSYGRRWRASRPTTVATVPVGYADGVRRSLGLLGGEVLIGGRRRPIAGVVTMDQLVVDCGDDPVAVGDEVVLIGRQGGEEITAAEIAERLGTIGYEILCDLGPRVPRRHRP